MRVFKTKKDFIIRPMGDEFLIVAVGEAGEEFNGFIRTNKTGAFYWHELEHGITKEDLVKKMLEKFEDLDAETANRDLNDFFEQMKIAIEEEAC